MRNLLISAMFCAVAFNASGAVWYVDKDNIGSEDGTSWSTAYNTIQKGIDAAFNAGGGEIWVAAGVYNEARTSPDADGSGLDTGSIVMKSGVHLYGGFAGNETQRDERNWVTNKTTLNGAAARGGNSAYHVVVGKNSATLDGFTVTGGNANGTENAKLGGGMYNGSSSPTVTNCTFSGNSATDYGGGMYNSTSAPTVTNCSFSQNSAGWGGGMFNNSSSLPITKCMFSENSADHGGGIYNAASSPTVTNCTFFQNTATGNGGGMRNTSGSSPSITNSTFSRNSAALLGGGIYNSASPTIKNCILWGSISGSDWYSSAGTPVITYSDIGIGYSGGGAGNISEDPMFADAPGGDLRLLPDSPCIDVGTATGAPATDILGVSRPQGVGIDMGAYEAPPTDITAPVITLLGESPVNVEVGGDYTDAGATALDDVDGDLTGSIVTVNPVNAAVLGSYTVTYNVSDSSGNAAQEVARTVHVRDTTPPAAPVITTNGGANYATNQAAIVLDGSCAGDTAQILVNESVVGVTYAPGATSWTYSGELSLDANPFSVVAVDAVGNPSVSDVITVTFDITPPRVLQASASGSSAVVITFSEPMTDDADLRNPSSYAFSGNGVPITATAVLPSDLAIVTVSVNPMTQGANYTVYVAVAFPTDLAGNQLDSLHTSASFTGVNPDDPDTDGDSIPDSWELENDLDFNNPADGALDSDGDGLTNLEEYAADTDPHDLADPASEFFVSVQEGLDQSNRGGEFAPWLTIGYAVSQIALFATANHPVTITLFETPGGDENDALAFSDVIQLVDYVTLRGRNADDPSATVIAATPPAQGAVIAAANNTAIENIEVRQKTTDTSGGLLLSILNKRVRVENAHFNGRLLFSSTGVQVKNTATPETFIRSCEFTNLGTGIQCINSDVNITENRFLNITANSSASKAISIGFTVKAEQRTPILGRRDLIAQTGFNQFRGIGGFFIEFIETGSTQTNAEYNDWGIYNEAAILDRIHMPTKIDSVDVTPIISEEKSFAPGVIVGVVLESDTNEPIPSTAATEVLLEELGFTDFPDEEGVFKFALVPDGDYTLVASADSFSEDRVEVTLVSGRIVKAPRLFLTDLAAGLSPEFHATPLEGFAPLEVQFTDDSQSSESIATWQWDFGDGAKRSSKSTDSAQHPVFVYTSPGLYTVSLTVTDSLGKVGVVTKQDYIHVAGHFGDVDGDDVVTAVDVQLVINAALSIPGEFNSDIDGDGDTDAVDVQLVINAALQSR